MQGGDCNPSDRRPASACPPQGVFTRIRKEDAKDSARRAREIRQTARRNAGTSADENATILYGKLWNGWPQPPSAATLSFEERIGVVRCYLGSWDHVIYLSEGKQEALVANLPDELYTASFETISTLFRQGEALGMSDPHEVAAHIIATFMSQKALADVDSWPHDLNESLGRRQAARDLTRGPPAPIGGELPVAFSVVIRTKAKARSRRTCEGPGGGAPCLESGGRGAHPTFALVLYAGAPADRDSFVITERQAYARGERDGLLATHCVKCGRRAAALAGGVVCIPLRTDMCVGTGGAACPGARRAKYVVVATEGATGAALGARVRTIRATPGLHRTHCARCGDAEARTRGSSVCVCLAGPFCEGPSAGSPCPGNRWLGSEARFGLADAGGSGDGAVICDAFFAARRGGLERFCAGCAADRATDKQFVTEMRARSGCRTTTRSGLLSAPGRCPCPNPQVKFPRSSRKQERSSRRVGNRCWTRKSRSSRSAPPPSPPTTRPGWRRHRADNAAADNAA